MVLVPGTYFRSQARVYHRDKEGVLIPFESRSSEKILDAVARGENSVHVPSRRWPQLAFGLDPGFRCDLKRMKLVSRCPETVYREEEDLVIEFRWDAKSFTAIVAQAGDDKLRRRVLVMALDRIRRPECLSKILAMKGLKTCTVRENPYLGPGHETYENFVDSLISTMAVSASGEQFLECAADDAKKDCFTCVGKQGIRTVFHGTNHAVMDRILSSGLDPRYRRRGLNEDYFGIDHATSLDYTKNKTGHVKIYKLLFFMIIGKPVDERTEGAVTVASNKLQLPLAEITL